MPRPPFPAPVLDLLREPRPAVIGVVRSDGSPVTAATWYLLEEDGAGGGQVVVNLDATRRRVAHMRANPQVSVTVLGESWYTHVTLLGRVSAWRDDVDLADIDRISRHYGGEPYAVRDGARVTAVIDVERWTAWGSLAGAR
ncbi:pyridoxamine 5'-phosphate oxidase family protein [Isoptericola sp. NEAU-Y5]|uniref:Pyridoxamine 5'-phosphate oxidase family protein n=1 Tax=Isoptericola luteus TaxID=2879484 RepID=A0ABS7ZIW1_9MICO|nr:pyridoxamine 5'-phosphate oxidase family protein [Isoptericola sp. NEAU-Y5]MCA5893720.1 pyridoxamine 5'-phosphate oxidase family protein [Isoptericola sp. NEAU-Y5]